MPQLSTFLKTATVVLLALATCASAGQTSKLRRAGQPAIRYTNPAGLVHNPRYSQVVEIQGGRTILISGQAALDSDGKVVGKGDFRAQATKVFDNLKIALGALGSDFGSVVKLNAYIVNMPSNISAYREVVTGYLPKDTSPPAMTTVGVAALVSPDLMLEVEAVAVLPAESR